VSNVIIAWDTSISTSGTISFSGTGTATADGTVGYGRLADVGRTYIAQGSAGTSALANFILSDHILEATDVFTVKGLLIQPYEV